MPRPPTPGDRADAEDVDRLYQAAPADFIAARTAHEKALRAAGRADEAARVHGLSRPSLAAWAVNQLYWFDRARYDALVSAGDEMRAVQRAMLDGRAKDPRGVMQALQEAVRLAAAAAAARVAASGAPLTDATRQKIDTTLQAIAAWGSAGKPFTPGRLETELALPGFEALAAMAGAAPPPSPLRLVKGAAEARKTATSGRVADAVGRDTAAARKEQARPAQEARAASAQLERARAAQSLAVDAERNAARGAEAARRAKEKTDAALEKARAAAEQARTQADAAAAAVAPARARREAADAAVTAATERLRSLSAPD